MSYIMMPEKNTYSFLQYDYAASADPSIFNKGVSLAGFKPKLNYKVKNRAKFKTITDLHLLQCTGPDLVSTKLRRILEKAAPAEIEFFEAKISFDNADTQGFYAINIINKLNCCDMQKSEYDTTDFDPNNPCYLFLYTVLLNNTPNNLSIIRCQEQPTSIVVNSSLKATIKDEKLPGLKFCSSLDLTPKNRSHCE
ncbi:imm11 family protein [Pseudomonas sp. NPDC089743]|uniref:imm11 family protein n=1 Tax=Pseudomonas sp. NPDC089743 TaxID=3364471 RepID=UPI003827FF60